MPAPPIDPEPTRHVRLDGASNFRDLGGYRTSDGRTVRWRRVFRSDHLGALTADDLERLDVLGLARVCDFRGVDERAELACAIPGVPVYALSIEPTVVQGMKRLIEAGHHVTAMDTVDLMRQTYRAFVHDNTHRFRAFFAHLLESDAPMVFHCTAGKDRTGFAAALLLESLGVSRQVVVQDYLLSNHHFQVPAAVLSAPATLPRAAIDVLWSVRQDFLEAGFQAIESQYGDLPRFLSTALGIDEQARQRLQAMYLTA